MKQKVIITIDKMPHQNSELSLKTNKMMLKVDVILEHYWNYVPEMKDIGRMVKQSV